MPSRSVRSGCWATAPTLSWTSPMGKLQAPRTLESGRICSASGLHLSIPRSQAKKVPSVRITLPDGAVVTSDQADISEILSRALYRKVTFDSAMLSRPGGSIANAEEYWLDMEGLEHRDTVTDFALPEGTFFDTAVVHLLTTATLDRLRDLYPQGRFEAHRFRPNIVVQTENGHGDFVENAWIGKVLAIGDTVRLSVTGPCPRCVMTTLPQGDLPKDVGILRAAAQHNQANVGIYASVIRGGKVRRGDSVSLQ